MANLRCFPQTCRQNPERLKFFGKLYPKYGHTHDQHEEAFRFGKMIGNALTEDNPIETLNFRTPLAMP